MFKKLRRHFLILNMVVISVMMIVSFELIYLLVNRNNHFQNLARLENAIYAQGAHYEFIDDFWGDVTLDFTISGTSDFETHFSVGLTDENEISSVNSTLIDFDVDFYEDAVNFILASGDTFGFATIGGREWLFETHEVMLPDANSVMNAQTTITFIDITASTDLLANLRSTFMNIAILMLLVILLISFIFSKYTVAPIEATWHKQKQFIADASHELKTPLAIISANIDAIGSIEGESDRFMSHIKDQSHRLAKLVNGLLFLANADDFNERIQLKKLNLSKLVEKNVFAMEAMIYEQGLKLTHDIKADIFVLGDAEKLSQVLTILLDNAIKYTTPNGAISIKCDHTSKKVLFEMSNEAPNVEGLNPEKFFDRFYRSDQARTHRTGGYGLGLSIARVIIAEMGGKISARIDQNMVKFTIVLNKNEKH